MADILANMIAGTRAQFAAQAHQALSVSHGHHFAVHQPKAPPPQRRPPPPRRPIPEMMDASAKVDPEKLLEQKQKKIAAHNARINTLNNSKAKEAEAVVHEPAATS
jgi:hypothetical protein